MTDDQGIPTGSGTPDDRPPAFPPAFSVESLETEIVVAPPKRRPAAYLAVAIGLLGLVGGAIFFVRSVGTSSSGAKTPQLAVQRLFDALSNEDALGVLESLVPAEREALMSRVQAVTKELSRLGILSKDVNLGDISGVDLNFSGLKFTTETIATGFSSVRLTQGRSTYSVDPAASPLGDYLRGLLPRSAAKATSGSADLAGEDINFTTVQHDGSWYVSLWYSVAEEARRDTGAPVPHFGAGVVARGTQTPESAVEQFLRAAALLDVRRLIELTPPDEAAALHDYAPLFIEDAERAVGEIRRAFSFTIRSLRLSHSGSGDEAMVKIDEISFRFAVPDENISVDYDGRCATVNLGGLFGPPGAQRICNKGLLGATEVPGFPRAVPSGIVTVRRDGLWYVSPTRTVLDGLKAALHVMTRSELEQFKQIFAPFGFGSTSDLPYPFPEGYLTPGT